MFANFNRLYVGKVFAVIAMFVGTVSFASSVSAQNVSSYQRGDYGTVQNVRVGVVRQMRQITINTDASTEARVMGGTLGGAVGGFVGNRSTGLVQFAAAALGAAGGDAIARHVASRAEQGTEYIVEVNGSLISVTQVDGGNFSIGQKVAVIDGRQARIVPLN